MSRLQSGLPPRPFIGPPVRPLNGLALRGSSSISGWFCRKQFTQISRGAASLSPGILAQLCVVHGSTEGPRRMRLFQLSTHWLYSSCVSRGTIINSLFFILPPSPMLVVRRHVSALVAHVSVNNPRCKRSAVILAKLAIAIAVLVERYRQRAF